MSNPLLENNKCCPKCGSPIFEIEGTVVSACLCGKKHEQIPLMGGLNTQLSNNTPIELLKELIANECADNKGNIVSRGKPIFAKTILFLSKIGSCTISKNRGFDVEGQWI